jgi:hypothetical protein
MSITLAGPRRADGLRVGRRLSSSLSSLTASTSLAEEGIDVGHVDSFGVTPSSALKTTIVVAAVADSVGESRRGRRKGAEATR